ncbi:thioredoxin [Corallococcus exercitus]|uniref:Thioredoxin n=2 Tax=Corallococcus TaxID=83461 RepID=A0A3A8HTE4_9BACT|nr:MULTISPECIES: thioredoxin [Corallococcus]MBN8230796.1 thioredoxin [Corallococcus macrosporus]NOK37149.1 thioredoxin [Corallococcus exercitus]RKG74487.1 thioredoxin [Corallococcus exercitus]
MATLEITKDNFKETVGKGGIVVLDWWATWCGPCKAFEPVYKASSETHQDIVFGKIDVDAQPELAGAFEVRAMPTLMVFRDGILLFDQPGALPKAALEDLIRQVRALNMDDVRREVEAQRASKEAPKA